MSAALSLPPQAPATSEQLAAVLRAVRLLTPGAHARTRYEVSAAWSMLAAQLQAYRLVAHIPADSALSGVPRDLRGAHAHFRCGRCVCAGSYVARVGGLWSRVERRAEVSR